MRIPVVGGIIKRRLLVNYRADPMVVQKVLPARFQPKLNAGHAIVGICLIRLEQIRPIGLPSFIGISSENAAHRFAVNWADEGGRIQEGVYIPRRDTGSLINRLAGGRLFPGEHYGAEFNVVDDGVRIDLQMRSMDGVTSVRVHGERAERLSNTSCFKSLSEASSFFEGGSLGYSATKDGARLDALRLHTSAWAVEPLAVETATSSYFEDTAQFPAGSVVFDHALIMRDVKHEWRQEESLTIH